MVDITQHQIDELAAFRKIDHLKKVRFKLFYLTNDLNRELVNIAESKKMDFDLYNKKLLHYEGVLRLFRLTEYYIGKLDV